MNELLLRTRNSPSRVSRMGAIWALVETRKALPVTIVVTSATAMEDTEAIGRGLAEAAAVAGKRAAFLGLSRGATGTGAKLPYIELNLPACDPQREAFDVASAMWRVNFDAVIIDAGEFSTLGFAVHLVRIADGVIVGICDKRRVLPADRELARFLEEVGSSLLGAVTTAPVNISPGKNLVADLSHLRQANQH